MTIEEVCTQLFVCLGRKESVAAIAGELGLCGPAKEWKSGLVQIAQEPSFRDAITKGLPVELHAHVTAAWNRWNLEDLPAINRLTKLRALVYSIHQLHTAWVQIDRATTSGYERNHDGEII